MPLSQVVSTQKFVQSPEKGKLILVSWPYPALPLLTHFLTQVNVRRTPATEVCAMKNTHTPELCPEAARRAHLPRASKWIGVLFLLPMLAYGGGSAWMGALLQGDAIAATWQWAGAALLLASNSVIVVLIALRFYPLVKDIHGGTAVAYLAARFAEAVLLLIGLLAQLMVAPMLTPDAWPSGDAHSIVDAGIHVNFQAYQLAMVALGVGSLPLFALLGRTGMLPHGLAWWAIGGYSLLALGAIGELCGLPYGIALSIPGGLLEVTLGIWLIVKGLRPPKTA